MKFKGFTLVELLAVIVILSVIALIATPAILNVIDNAKRGAFEARSRGIVDAAVQSYMLGQLNDNALTLTEYQYENGNLNRIKGNIDVSYKGSNPENGTLLINRNGKVAIAFYENGYCASKSYDNGTIEFGEISKEDCKIVDDSLNDRISIVSNSGDYVAITPGTDVSLINYFTTKSESELVSNTCKINGKKITTTSTLEQGDYLVDCSIENKDGDINSASIQLAVNSCYQFDASTNTISNYYCYQGNSEGQPTITDLNIPFSINQVKVIRLDPYTFYDKNLTSVTIPNGIEEIRNYAFSFNKLVSATLSNTLTTIGESAFAYNALTTIELPKTLTIIGSSAFRGNQLKSLIIPNSVTKIENSAFSNNQLNSVELPNNIKEIADFTFYSNQLTSLTIPNTVSTIGYSAFKGNQLKNLTIPNSVITIGGAAFFMNQLESIVIPDSVLTIDESAFILNKLKTIVLSNRVTTIGESAFEGNQLTTVIIPNSVTTIGSSAFCKSNSTNLLTSIQNKTGKSYNWSNITCANQSDQTFVTGTVTHQDGNILITAS